MQLDGGGAAALEKDEALLRLQSGEQVRRRQEMTGRRLSRRCQMPVNR